MFGAYSNLREDFQIPRPFGGRPTGTGGAYTPRTTSTTNSGTSSIPTGGAASATNPALNGMSQSPYMRFLGSLGKPITGQVGYTGTEEQQMFNRMRERIQGGTKLGMEQMKTYMGGKGFHGGESGIADTALGQIAQKGQEELAGASRDVALAGAEKRFQDQMQLANLNLQRILGGAGIALQGEESAANRMMDYLGMMVGSQQAAWQPYWSGITGLASTAGM